MNYMRQIYEFWAFSHVCTVERFPAGRALQVELGDQGKGQGRESVIPPCCPNWSTAFLGYLCLPAGPSRRALGAINTRLSGPQAMSC